MDPHDPSTPMRSWPAAPPTRVLILGGSSEATALARALAERPDIAATLSFAGRTARPLAQPIPTRVGGFGGIDGLASYLEAERVDMLVDATHPFAVRISDNARAAARLAHCPLLRVSRPAWTPRPGDIWHDAGDMDAAVALIGTPPRRVFLTIGSLRLQCFRQASQHHYWVRTIDPVADGHGLANATFIEACGPFDTAGEERLMRDHRIDVLVTKNSGGEAAAAKLEAARRLGIPVILLRRPEGGTPASTVAEALAAIDAHRPPARRGV